MRVGDLLRGSLAGEEDVLIIERSTPKPTAERKITHQSDLAVFKD